LIGGKSCFEAATLDFEFINEQKGMPKGDSLDSMIGNVEVRYGIKWMSI